MDVTYYVTGLNSFLATVLSALCIVKARWRLVRSARDFRVSGLTLLAIAIAWGSAARHGEPFKPWYLLVTIGLVLCTIGMWRIADGELDDLIPRRRQHARR